MHKSPPPSFYKNGKVINRLCLKVDIPELIGDYEYDVIQNEIEKDVRGKDENEKDREANRSRRYDSGD